MRITNNMMKNNYLNNLNVNLNGMHQYQDQLSSGKVINSLSDDPVALISIMSSNVKLGKNEQYQSTVNSAITWLEQTDTSAYELNEVLQSAYEKVVQISNDHLSSDDKAATAEYIKQLRDQVLSIANGQAGDKYMFGGYNVNKEPFTLDSSGNILYNGIDLTNDADPNLIAKNNESITYEIGPGIKMGISITGSELIGMGSGNAYTVLDGLYDDLMSDSPANVLDDYMTKLQDCQSNALTVEAKVGGMANRLELMQNRYEEENLTNKELKSKVEDVDYAEAYLNYSMDQTVYNAALQVGTQIMQASVLDYLK